MCGASQVKWAPCCTAFALSPMLPLLSPPQALNIELNLEYQRSILVKPAGSPPLNHCPQLHTHTHTHTHSHVHPHTLTLSHTHTHIHTHIHTHAHSERLDRSQAVGARKAEACAINTSLSSVGDVFEALSTKQKHVPFRNSKLTYLLKVGRFSSVCACACVCVSLCVLCTVFVQHPGCAAGYTAQDLKYVH